MSNSLVKLMGVINVTPDSFSDGGKYNTIETALEKADQYFKDGADLVDLGAESTRPGALPLSHTEEWRRLEPVISSLTKNFDGRNISVDTRHKETMLRVLDMGIMTINDVSGFADRQVLKKVASTASSYIGMHVHKNPQTMQVEPLKGKEALSNVSNYFNKTYKTCLDAGLENNQIFLDPGIGFGKDDEANVSLMANTMKFSEKYQLALGVSRKSFIGRTLNITDPLDRDPASKMLEFGLMMLGAKIIRSHEVATLRKLRTYLGEGYV